MKRVLVIVSVFLAMFSTLAFSGCHLFSEECGCEGLFYNKPCASVYNCIFPSMCDCPSIILGKTTSELTEDDYIVDTLRCEVVEKDQVIAKIYDVRVTCYVKFKKDLYYGKITVVVLTDDIVIETFTEDLGETSAGVITGFRMDKDIREVYDSSELSAVIYVTGVVLD